MDNDLIYKLEVTSETGEIVTIKVLDIIDSEEFRKAFIIYTLLDDSSNVFASILNESEDSYSLDKIENAREIEFVKQEIEEIINEMEDEEL